LGDVGILGGDDMPRKVGVIEEREGVSSLASRRRDSMVWPITRVGVAEDERNRRIAYRLASVERLSPVYVRFFGCGEDPRGE
jgi:hypothetical protein